METCNILEEISPDIFPSFCMEANVQSLTFSRSNNNFTSKHGRDAGLGSPIIF